MKKQYILTLAATAAAGSFGFIPAHADPVAVTVPGNSTVAGGTVAVDPSGYDLVILDPDSNWGSPLAGYAIVHSDGTFTCGEHDGPYNDDGTPSSTWNQGQGNDENPNCA